MKGFSEKRLRTHGTKAALLVFIIATLLFPLTQINTTLLEVAPLTYLSSATGLIAGVMFVWMLYLGSRQLMRLISADWIWVNEIHKDLGKVGLLLVVVHFASNFISKTSQGISLINLNFGNNFDIFVKFGSAAFALVLLIILTSWIGRRYFQFRWWKRIHLVSYAIPGLVLIHGWNIGSTLQFNQTMQLYWQVFALAYIALIAWKLAYLSIGLGSYKYTLSATSKLTDDVTRLVLTPSKSRSISPHPGQFVYTRLQPWTEAHPFTVAEYKVDSGELVLAVKKFGKFTTMVENMESGQQVFIDGPYGVFGSKCQQYMPGAPVVMVAGGIGITPFISLIDILQKQGREIIMLYGNKTESDIAYRTELENKLGDKLVHVLSDQPDFDGETGYIDLDLIKKYMPENTELDSCNFLVCGPPVMLEKLLSEMNAAGITAKQVDYELFSL